MKASQPPVQTVAYTEIDADSIDRDEDDARGGADERSLHGLVVRIERLILVAMAYHSVTCALENF